MKPAFLICTLIALATASEANANPSQIPANAAQAQIGITLHYDPSYQRLPYPNGDVPLERGVCTDVVIRAYRQLGIDLQNWSMKTCATTGTPTRIPHSGA